MSAPPQTQGSTSAQAGAVAAAGSQRRYAQIVRLLAEQPRAIFECAEALGVLDHQISGRFTELSKAHQIEPTGERRPKPATGCLCEVWRIAAPATQPAAPPANSPEAIAAAMGYPARLAIRQAIYERQPLCDPESWPGIPYALTSGGVRQVHRIALVECPACGRPLIQAGRAKDEDGKEHHIYRCANPDGGSLHCNRDLQLVVVNEPGRAPMLALLQRRL